MKVFFSKDFKILGLNKFLRKEARRDKLRKRHRKWFFINAIKYSHLDYDDESFKQKVRIKFYGFLRRFEYKLYMRQQKKLKVIYNANNIGYVEFSNIFNDILYLTTCMGIEYRNFGNAVDETIKDEVRSLWKFRRMVKDYLNIEDNFHNLYDNIIKRKFGQKTELKLKFNDTDDKCVSTMFEYENNDTGTSFDISNYHDAITSDKHIGMYSKKDDISPREKYEKEFFQYMMEFFYKNYKKWWD